MTHRVRWAVFGLEGYGSNLIFKISFFFYIGIWLIYNFVFISDVQEIDSVICTHISILFQFLFPGR